MTLSKTLSRAIIFILTVALATLTLVAAPITIAAPLVIATASLAVILSATI